ncbi:caspase family protein [Streptomyces sp. NPDC051963]|uniref:HD domain-containing protein n=1 Tax=Streptomyces sp. NPDC051963 TaxID=3365678 RepID=UPI0037CD6451
MGHSARRALLVGVGDTPAAPSGAESLDAAVAADLTRMKSVLHDSHYEVRTLHNAEAGRSRIRATISEVAGATPEGGTLLLYFTGHGIRVGTDDFLVPWDVTPPEDGNWEEPYIDSLLPAKISPLLKRCRATTVLWLIDACRTEMPDDGVPFGNSIDNGPPHGGFAVMTGCSPGELSGFTPRGSFFTGGLVEALDSMTSARTVQSVFTMARQAAQTEANRHRVPQLATIRYGTNLEAETRAAEICEGQELLEAWRDAVRSCPLWKRVEESQQACVPGLLQSLETWVKGCADTLHTARKRMPEPDPWVDDLFPIRLLGDRLPRLLPDTVTLSAVEAAVLVAAPFLHEAAWADRLSRAAEADPLTLDPQTLPNEDRRHYEQVIDQYARMARKVADCRARGREQDATTVTMWLVHRWIAERFETDSSPVPVGPADDLASLLLGQDREDGRVKELSELLCSAAAAIGLPEPREDTHLHARGKVLLNGNHQTLRIQPLAALLRLAAVLAVDVRTFPEIVAEHLAVSDPVQPHQVIAIVRQLAWEKDHDALHLDALCPHQALHAALTEVAERADQIAEEVLTLADTRPASEAGLLAAVPRKVTPRGVGPTQVGNVLAYETPLLRFRLAQTEVRELLMGEQLYSGEPQLALRELYQNAMDACRYRAMRWKYLTSMGMNPDDWSGRITIRQGEDARGRFVECRDNGVGMSAEQLKYTFTRAGSRFEQSKAFRREQSRWLRHDPELRLYPNSRFGIGVFSYFMLADEMTIVTRQVNQEGIPDEHALQVDIPSSGSLFRIKRHDGAGDSMSGGGTLVRLYLRDGPVTDGLSCVKTLRELVQVSEFALRVCDASGLDRTWAPRVLHQEAGAVAEALEAVPDVLWWVPGRGAVLCDGIATDKQPFGYVLNLTGPHAGRLSVNRKELQAYDPSWAEQNWRAGAAALARWPELTMEWLWQLESDQLPAATALHDEWRGQGMTVRRGASDVHSLDVQGWFRLDQPILERWGRDREPFDTDMELRYIAPWRAAALALARGSGETAQPLSVEGYPVPEPGDADIWGIANTWWGVVAHAEQRRLTVAEVINRRRRLRPAHKRQAPPPITGEVPSQVPDGGDRAIIEAFSNPWSIVSDGPGGPDDLGGVVLASERLALPLGEVVRRCARYACLGRETPWPAVPAHHEEYVCTADDIDRLVLARNDVYSTSLSRVSTPEHVQETSRHLGLPASEILAALSRFEWLGWTAPPAEQVTAWAELEADVQAVLQSRLRVDSEGHDTLPWTATFDLASGRGISLGEAEECLAHAAARLGMIHERQYAHDSLASQVVPAPYVVEVIDTSLGDSHGLEDRVGLEQLGRAARPWTGVENRFLDAVEQLRTAGVAVPDDLTPLFAWRDLPLRTRFVLSGKEASSDTENWPTDRLTTASLFQSAGFLHESLREVWGIAEREAPRFGLTVPVLPEELADHHPSAEECSALTDQRQAHSYYLPSEWQPLTPLSLADFAAELKIGTAAAYARLAALRPLGALVPELSQAAAEALPDSPPTRHDLAALDEEYRVSGPDQPLTPLDLVSLAARLGEPLPDLVRRIEPYIPLLPVPVALPPVPGVVPLWQDLALLSRCFDGVLPAVEGLVTARHITLAAQATDETEDWIRGRLRLYSAMFDLRLEGDDA